MGEGQKEKYNVEKLIVSLGKDEEGESVRNDYLEKVLERAREDWSEEDGVDEKWSATFCTCRGCVRESRMPSGRLVS